MNLPDDRFDLVDRLFERVLDLPPEERSAFLAAAGAEETVRLHVERLLAVATGHGADLRSGGAWGGALAASLRRSLGEEEPFDLAPGATLGRYRLLREIGRGGMAVVYLAERTASDFQQQVAVKILKRGLDSDEILRRFARERQILATARHPGLARLLDGGMTGDGRPYLVMEHVEGKPIDQHCDARRLGVPQRVRLFLQVARAVEAAHRSLVVHRDIKPSNVLVTSDGHAKLLDFGIAKLLDAEGGEELTHPLSRPLTPAFASPEQLAGEPVTAASDVYQLGLLLFRLLAGGAPTGSETSTVVPSKWLRALAPEAARDSAAARSTTAARLARTLEGDLDTLVQVALRSDPERRYGSVAALVADLERYLDGRPLAARRDTFGYRLQKFSRRHRAAVATALFALLLVVATALAYGLRLTRERDRAEQEARRATATTDFLRGLFRVASPSRSRGEQVTARELLQRGTERLRRSPSLPPELRADLLVEVGGVYRELAFYEEAERLLQEAVALRRRHPGTGALGLAAALQGLAEVRLERGQPANAESLFSEALAIRERALPPGHPDLALALVGLGRSHADRARFGRAAELQGRALAQLERALGPGHEEVGRAARHLARSLRGLDRADEARRHLERSLAILEATVGADHAFAGTARVELAEVLADSGERALARVQFEGALPVLERVYGPDHPALAHAYTALADVLIAPGPDAKDPVSAIAHYRRSLAIREQAFGALHPKVADTLVGLGRACALAGQDGEARASVERALAILTARSGPEHIDLAVPVGLLADVQRRSGHPRAALALYQRVVDLRRRHLGPEHPSLTLPLVEMARIHRAAGRPEAALTILRRVLRSQGKGPGAGHGLGFLHVEVAGCLTDLGKLQEAEAELLPVSSSAEPHTRRRALEGLVALYRRWGRATEAARAEVALREAKAGPDPAAIR